MRRRPEKVRRGVLVRWPASAVGPRERIEMRPLGIAQERRDQQHHLIDAMREVFLGRLRPRTAHGVIGQPECRNQQDVFCRGLDFIECCAQNVGLRSSEGILFRMMSFEPDGA